SAGLRVLQPQRSRDARCGLRLVPWSRRPDGGRLSAGNAEHGVVPGLPPQPRAPPPAAVRSHQHELDPPWRSDRLRGPASRAEQHPSPDGLLHMSSMKPKSLQDPSTVSSGELKTPCDAADMPASAAADTSAAPSHWRSLAELDNDPEFREFVAREFKTPLEEMPLSSKGRRRFMQLMGASFALAGCRWKEDKLLPFSERPEGFVPGEPVFYATAMDIAGVATGLWAKSFDGRPIKIEGNPNSASSLGATNTYHQ